MNDALGKIFGSRIRAKLLGWFFSHVDEQFFVRQLAPILKEDPTNLSRELAKLEGIGILTSARQGNLKQFRVNKDCSFLSELKGLVLKTTGIAGQIKAALGSIAGIEVAFIYGSVAKGRETADSDVDLLIVGDVDMDALEAALQGFEERLGRTVNYLLYNRREFEEKVTSRDGFLTDVLKGDKIVLIGEVHGPAAA